MNILMIDDSWLVRTKIGKGLRGAGLSVTEADSGRSGLETMKSGSFDCILLDLLMPEMSGFEVLAEMNTRGISIPVVVHSADIQETTRERCLSLDARAFAAKPTKIEDLVSILEKAANTQTTDNPNPTDQQMSVIQELVNVGVGKGASMLNDLLESHVELQVPIVKILTGESMIHAIQKEGDGPLASVCMEFTSDSIEGCSDLIFSEDSALRLVKLMTGGICDDEDSGTVRTGTLCEIGNIVLNGVMGSIGNALDLHLTYSVPSFLDGKIADIMTRQDINAETVIILARTRFVVAEHSIEGDLALFLELGSIDHLLDAIDIYADE